MKVPILVLLSIILTAPASGQNRVLLSYDPGTNLHNSENALQTIGDKSLGRAPGFSILIERDSVFGDFGGRINYSYTHAIASNALQFAYTSFGSPAIVGYFWADVSQDAYNLDIGASYAPVEPLVFEAGPTVSLVHRTITCSPPPSPYESVTRTLDDRLVSYCAGGHASVNLELPVVRGRQSLLLFSSLKIRYLHSVLFDARGRNLDNYHQSILLGQFCVGFGVEF